MEKSYALGIDIGGTNIAFGFVNMLGEVIYEQSTKTNSYKDPLEFIQYLKKSSEISTFLAQTIGIGIGAPNGNFFTGNIEHAPNLRWKGIIPLKQLFETAFSIPTILTNDANAAAVGEKKYGCATNYTHFVEITLGTGLGSGIFANNNLLYGAYGSAGEYGHFRVIPNGRKCKCGRNGCLETYASSTGVVRSISELESLNKANSSLLRIKKPNAEHVFKEAQKGDLFALEIIEFTSQILGNALADFATFSDPEAFILFGGIAQSGEYFRQKVEQYMNANLLTIFKNKIKVKTSALHEKNAAILGNAAIIFHSILD